MKILLPLLLFVVCLNLAALVHVSVPVKDADATIMATHRHWQLTGSSRGYNDYLLPDTELSLLADHDYRLLNTYSYNRVLSGYHSYEQMLAQLQTWAAAHPNICRLVDLGPSQACYYYNQGNDNYRAYRRHHLWAMFVSDNPMQEEDEPEVFIGGSIHAREPIGEEVTLNIMDHLINGYGTDSLATRLVNTTGIWFMPLINPDGNYLVYKQLQPMYRKNLRDNNANLKPDSTSTADGVDLNRNFGYVWGPYGTSSTPSSDTYNGPTAFSEHETQIIRDFFAAHRFYGAITYHSYGGSVLYPLGHLPGARALDNDIMASLAAGMAAQIPYTEANGAVNGNYVAQNAGVTATCQGTMGDWAYAAERVFGFTIETSYTFIPAAAQVPVICQNNLTAALNFIDRPHYAALTGSITGADGQPVEAEIFVQGVDDNTGCSPCEPYRTKGRPFYRPLLPGTYTVIISAQGYPSQTKQVVISPAGVTRLNVCMATDFVQDVEIIADNGMVCLQWPSEPGCTYTVLSSPAVDGDYSVDLLGISPGEGQWLKNVNGKEREFYQVLRIAGNR